MRWRWRGAWLLLGAALLGGTTACGPAADLTPAARTEYMTDAHERRFGHAVDAEITNFYPVVRGHPALVSVVEDVGRRLVKVSHRPELPYDFRVLNSADVNAFAGPGGYVYVTTGLLKTLDDVDELAAILAHEIAHVNGRHSVRALRSAQFAQAGIIFANILATLGAAATGVGAVGDLTFAAGYLTTLIVFQGYSRSYENQADRLGIHYMLQAGYQPEAMVRIFKRFIQIRDEEKEKRGLAILQSHPQLEDRIKEVEEMIRRERAGQKPEEPVS